MQELFSPSNMTWLVPLLVVCALMILLAAYALRDDIAAVFRSFLMPAEKRYTLSQPIIAPSAQTQKQPQPAQQAPQQMPAPQPPDLYQPSPFTIIDKAQFTSNLQAYKAPKEVFHVMGAMSRWYWRKISRKFKTRPQQAAPAPAAEPLRAAAYDANLEAAPAKPAPVQQPQSGTVMPDIPQQQQPAPSALAPAVPATQHSKSKILTGERVFFTAIMLALMAFIIFLTKQVGKLSAAVEVQNNYISTLQNRGVKVRDFISYEPPPAARK
ncbi:MAG: hypothetical protein LBL61_03295 [Elusimicrobiota bacterium]|jgi:hypothetical protein|nr:hypothetical protein [Elusimicrobiota bacterium]